MGLIAFDCDGPLAHFTARLCYELSGRGHYTEERNIRHWDLSASLSPEANSHVHSIVSAPGFCHGLSWVSGARQAVRELRANGHNVVCVTSPYDSPTWISERSAWLSELFPAEDVLFVKSKRKALVYADVLVEDHPGILAAWLEAHPKGWGILVDRPWNQPGSREFWPHSRMLRSYDINHMKTLIDECIT